MKNSLAILAPYLLAVLLIEPASASRCDAHFPFDGNLADATGNGYDGMMITENGGAGEPQFGEGKYGQALHITGNAAMRSFLDLHHDGCPQFTITAWFKLPSVGAEGAQAILSTGARGGIPAIIARDSSLTLHGSGNGLTQKDAIRDGRIWFFVAATFDYEARTYKLYWRNRSQEGKLSETPYNPEDSFWIGTLNDDLRLMAQDLYIDDVRVYGHVLDLDEIRDTSTNVMAHGASQSQSSVSAITNATLSPPFPAGRRPSINIPEDAVPTRPPLGEMPIFPETPDADPTTWNNPEQQLADPNSQAVIYGRITDASGNGVADTTAVVYRAANDAHIAHTTTGSDGRYTIAVFASEPIKIGFYNSRNFPYISREYASRSLSLDGAKTFKIAPGDQIEVDGELQILNCHIEGVVSDVSGLRLPGVQVGFYQGEWLNARGRPSFLHSTMTNSDGVYTFDLSTIEDWSHFESIVGSQGCYGSCEAIRMMLQAFDSTGTYEPKTEYHYFHIQVSPITNNGADHCNDLDPEITMQ